MRCVCLITLPAALGLAMLASPLLITLFQYKAFSQYDVFMTSYSLMAYAIGLPAFVFIKVLSAGFFSRQDTKTPVKIGIIAVTTNFVLNIILVLLFNRINLGHVGLALATSLSAYLQAFLLFSKLKKIQVYQPRKKWLGFFMKIILALIVMGVVIIFGGTDVSVWFDWSVFRRVSNLILWVLLSMLSYFTLLWLAGLRLSSFRSTE